MSAVNVIEEASALSAGEIGETVVTILMMLTLLSTVIETQGATLVIMTVIIARRRRRYGKKQVLTIAFSVRSREGCVLDSYGRLADNEDTTDTTMIIVVTT